MEKPEISKLKIMRQRKNNSSKEVIWLNKDKLDLLIYEEKRRKYLKICENLYNNDDNNLDQFDMQFWFNDKD